MLSSIPPRRSNAALRSAAQGETSRTITIALVANLDSAALVGVMLAAAGLLLSELVGNNTPDALASLLMASCWPSPPSAWLDRWPICWSVARCPPTASSSLARILASDPAIEQVLSLHAVYTGPQEVIVAAKVHPAAGLTIDELTRAMDSLDTAVRSALPEVADVYLDVTSDRLDTRPGAQPVGTTE